MSDNGDSEDGTTVGRTTRPTEGSDNGNDRGRTTDSTDGSKGDDGAVSTTTTGSEIDLNENDSHFVNTMAKTFEEASWLLSTRFERREEFSKWKQELADGTYRKWVEEFSDFPSSDEIKSHEQEIRDYNEHIITAVQGHYTGVKQRHYEAILDEYRQSRQNPLDLMIQYSEFEDEENFRQAAKNYLVHDGQRDRFAAQIKSCREGENRGFKEPHPCEASLLSFTGLTRDWHRTELLANLFEGEALEVDWQALYYVPDNSMIAHENSDELSPGEIASSFTGIPEGGGDRLYLICTDPQPKQLFVQFGSDNHASTYYDSVLSQLQTDGQRSENMEVGTVDKIIWGDGEPVYGYGKQLGPSVLFFHAGDELWSEQQLPNPDRSWLFES